MLSSTLSVIQSRAPMRQVSLDKGPEDQGPYGKHQRKSTRCRQSAPIKLYVVRAGTNDVEGDAVLARRHRQPNAFAEPARLQERHILAASRARHGSHPQIRHRRLRHPTRIALVRQIAGRELRVQRGDGHVVLSVRRSHSEW